MVEAGTSVDRRLVLVTQPKIRNGLLNGYAFSNVKCSQNSRVLEVKLNYTFQTNLTASTKNSLYIILSHLRQPTPITYRVPSNLVGCTECYFKGFL